MTDAAAAGLVLTEIDDQNIAHVTINRPDKRNALVLDSYTELAKTFRGLRKNRDVRAVILSGAGASFCSGMDTSVFTGSSPAATLRRLLSTVTTANFFQAPMWEMRKLPVPIIAAVKGHCYGGGLQIALAADFRLADSTAEFSVLETRFGIIPDLTAALTLPELVRMDVAKRLVMTGEFVKADQALQLGLITELTDDPHAKALELAREIAQRSPDAVAAAKRLYQGVWNHGARVSLLAERLLQVPLLAGKSFRVATKAYAEKSTPKFPPRSW
jgi:enoyl-CoA hydratase/carnithine racemase